MTRHLVAFYVVIFFFFFFFFFVVKMFSFTLEAVFFFIICIPVHVKFNHTQAEVDFDNKTLGSFCM